MSATSPRIKGGLVVLALGGQAVQRAVALQYNPETLTRTLEPQGEAGAAVETIHLVATFDATDALEHPDANAAAMRAGIAPQLAVLEALVQPAAKEPTVLAQRPKAKTEAPLVLFVWGANRVVPVRITHLSIVEDAFDRALNPLRARVTLGLRVLTNADFGPTHRGAALYLDFLQKREALARAAPVAALHALGLGGLP